MGSGLLTTTTTRSATAATVAQEVPAVSTSPKSILPLRSANLKLFADMLQHGAPEPLAERFVMDLLRQGRMPKTARDDTKKRLEHMAECLARRHVERPIIHEVLTVLEQQHGILLGGTELQELITAAISAAGEPDAPRRQAMPAMLEVAAPAEGWQRHVILGAMGDDRHKTVRSLTGSLLTHRVDPYITAALAIAWAWACCDPPIPANEVLSIVNWVAKRHAEGVA
jgi:hypothetical protein